MITVPPERISRSAQCPREGFADRPLKPSEPPHFTPRVSSLRGIASRSTPLQASSRLVTSATPRLTASFVPPHSWMEMLAIGLSQPRPSCLAR